MMPTEAADIQYYLKEKRQLIDGLLDRYLPSEEAEPKLLHAAMRYSVMAGGKRLRPILALTACEYCGGNVESKDRPIHWAAAALEMVHTYSLIHDDLPCMDDDDLRRGIPTCHMKFGEAVAVLAGDALHDLAFNLMARTGSTEAVAELAQAIGTDGMLGGQIADVEAEGRDVTRDDIINIHTRKTAALIRCSVRLGAMLGGADAKLLSRLTRYGEKVGLAFQIIDDVLDIEGDQKLLGKNTGSDRKKQKATYPQVVGVERARRDASQLIDESVALFDADDENMLKSLALYIGQRQY
ncbi:MAG: polyprenyl synthetase family protein [Candidatus Zixiibacteriota bacterium]|nr:MAG: polyprenyl synthetase family protein [candidate division Zixibacteria bacterium]